MRCWVSAGACSSCPCWRSGLGLPLREAVGVSLLAVIGTSSASAATYLRRGTANLRLGLTLEVVTVVGAIVGGLVAFAIDERLVAAAFGIMLIYVAITMVRRRSQGPDAGRGRRRHRTRPAGRGVRQGLVRTRPDSRRRSRARNTTCGTCRPGIALSGLAGMISALLGVGGGIVLVPTMHLAMGLPLRAATATSNLTIGVTASASAALYILRDSVDPLVAAPVLVGTFLGATAAARLAPRVPVAILRWIFVVVLLYVAFQMLSRAIGPAAIT